MRAALAAGLALAASAAPAQEPPLWANLAECSAVFRATALSGGYGGVTAEQIAVVQQRTAEAGGAQYQMAEALNRTTAAAQGAQQALAYFTNEV
ncbi:MAG: hypothetical protein V4583_14955, partial [Pseudomonadota bacterium]